MLSRVFEKGVLTVVRNQERDDLFKLGEWFIKTPIPDRKSFRESVIIKINGEKAIKGANEFFDRLEADF